MRTTTQVVLLTLAFAAINSASGASLRTELVSGPHPLARQLDTPADFEDYQNQFFQDLSDAAKQFPHPRGAPPVHKLGTVDLAAQKPDAQPHKKIDKKAKAKAGKKPQEPNPKPIAEEEPTAEAPAAEAPATETEAPAVEASAPGTPPAPPIVDDVEAPIPAEPEAPVAVTTEEEPAAGAPGLETLGALLTPTVPAPEKRLMPNNFASNPPQPDPEDMPPAPFSDLPAPDAPPAQQAAYYFGELQELKDIKSPGPAPVMPQKRAVKKHGKNKKLPASATEDAGELEEAAVPAVTDVDSPATAHADDAAAPIVAEPAVVDADAAAPAYPSPEEVKAGIEGALSNLQQFQPAGTPAGTKREALIKELRLRGLQLDDGIEAAKRQVDEAFAYVAKTGRSIVAGDMLGSLAGDKRLLARFADATGPVTRAAAAAKLQESLRKLSDELDKVALDPNNLSPAPRMYNHKVKPRATPFIG